MLYWDNIQGKLAINQLLNFYSVHPAIITMGHVRQIMTSILQKWSYVQSSGLCIVSRGTDGHYYCKIFVVSISNIPDSRVVVEMAQSSNYFLIQN